METGPPTPAQVRALRRRDPVLGAAMGQVAPFPRLPKASQGGSHFHALARAIIHQQLATAAAGTIHRRVLELTPGPRFPSAQEIERLDDATLRGAGLSRAKLAALRDLSQRSLDGRLRLRRLGRLADEEVIEELVQVRGIGRWTAQMFLLFRLARLDVMAPADLGLQEGMRILDGLAERPSAAALEARAEVWAPLRSVAAWTLWRLTDQP